MALGRRVWERGVGYAGHDGKVCEGRVLFWRGGEDREVGRGCSTESRWWWWWYCQAGEVLLMSSLWWGDAGGVEGGVWMVREGVLRLVGWVEE